MTRKLLIVEDEALIADHLALILDEQGYEVVGILDEPSEVLDFLKHKAVDLVLLDINLSSDLDGVDLAGILNNTYNMPFVYVSSNSDPTTIERVKHTSPLGFIVKPFTKESIRTSLELAFYNIEKTHDLSGDQDTFFLKEKHSLIKFFYKDILFAEANDNYTILHTQNKRHVISSTLKIIEQKLSGHKFMRCHRSFVVNIDAITKIEPKTVYINDHEIPMSDSYKSVLLNKVNLF